jgi:prepilin-type N-terminal cleavage/methylation domain-containing protein
MEHHNHKSSGFTLIELSVVLVIIGLIASGILIGRDLIRSAEMRKVQSQFEAINSAVNTFQNKYNCLAGDCANATTFFGADPTCSVHPGYFFNDTPGAPTCNGDGDGRLDANNTYYEMTTFWQHMAYAGLLSGSYTGGWPTAAQQPAFIPGVNTPEVLGQNSYWLAFDGDNSVLFKSIPGFATTIVPGSFGTVLGVNGYSVNGQLRMFTPTEAQALDTKYDDGNPASGHILVAVGMTHCTNAPAGEAVSKPANASAQYLSGDATYKDAVDCNLVYLASF